jgi:hypothetical protein
MFIHGIVELLEALEETDLFTCLLLILQK